MVNDLYSLARAGNLEKLKVALDEANKDYYGVVEEDMNLDYITNTEKVQLNDLIGTRPGTSASTDENGGTAKNQSKPSTASSTQSAKTDHSLESNATSVVSFKDLKGPWYNQTHPLDPSLYIKKVENLGNTAQGNGVKRHLKPVNQTRWSGDTIMHRACIGGNLETVKYLVEEAGADFRMKSVWGGYTPLHLAAKYGHEEVCEYLMLKGSDWEDTDKKGKTCFDYCIEGGNTVVAWRLNKGNEDRKHERELERQRLWLDSLRTPTPSTADKMEESENMEKKQKAKAKEKEKSRSLWGMKSTSSPKGKKSPKNK